MYSIDYEVLRQEHSASVDYASQWGFNVYEKVLPILGSDAATVAAHKVYYKILEQEGVPCRKK